MFGRSSKKKQSEQSASNLPIGTFGSSFATGTPFILSTDLVTDPVSGWQAMMNPGTTELLLYAPHGGYVQDDLRNEPVGKWIALVDGDARRLPMDICVKQGRVEARWIEVVGDRSDPHEFDRMSPSERQQLTDDAFRQLSENHYKVMNWIGGIR